MSQTWMSEYVGKFKDHSADVERTERASRMHEYLKQNMTIDEYRGYCKGQILIGLLEMTEEKIEI